MITRNRPKINVDIEKYIATSSQFNHPGNHKKVHAALNAVNWELSLFHQEVLRETQSSKFQYSFLRLKKIVLLEKHLNDLDTYLTYMDRKVKSLPRPKFQHNGNDLNVFRGKQGSIADAIRRLKARIRSIKGILGNVKSDYDVQKRKRETIQMMEQIDEPLSTDPIYEQHTDIFNAGVVLVWGILVLWKRKR